MPRVLIPQSQNLCLWSEDWSNAAWSKQAGVTATANTADVTDPNGGNRASKIAYDGSSGAGGVRLVQALGTMFSGLTFTISFWARLLSGTRNQQVTNNTSLAFTTITVTSVWQRFVVAQTTILDGGLQWALYDGGGLNSAYNIYLFGGQVVQANWSGPYVSTTGAAINTGPLRNVP